MRLATWNINSVRLRLPLLKKLMEEHRPDVIALQETKTPDEFFPFDDIKKAGYKHTHFTGMKSYNGIAILSKVPLDTHQIYHRTGREDCRHHSAIVHWKKGKKLELHSVYIPAGGDIPDPEQNDKFAHKLDFVDELNGWWPEYRKTHALPMIMVGDLNIAPLEHDVWSHKQLLNTISHTQIEIEKFTRMQKSIGWYDALRHFTPETEKLYTWWSYRNQDWEKSNRGRRLDHIWVTPDLKDNLKKVTILREARNWTQPSDHVPVILDLDI